MCLRNGDLCPRLLGECLDRLLQRAAASDKSWKFDWALGGSFTLILSRFAGQCRQATEKRMNGVALRELLASCVTAPPLPASANLVDTGERGQTKETMEHRIKALIEKGVSLFRQELAAAFEGSESRAGLQAALASPDRKSLAHFLVEAERPDLVLRFFELAPALGLLELWA